MKKNLLALILVFLLFFSVSCKENKEYDSTDVHSFYFKGSFENINEKQLYLIKLKDGLINVPSDLIVPKYLSGIKVDGLDYQAFGTYTINSVYVPDSLQYIPFFLLEDSNVGKIYVPAEHCAFEHFSTKVIEY